jgi:Ca2+-binding RTX toxin-like protein
VEGALSVIYFGGGNDDWRPGHYDADWVDGPDEFHGGGGNDILHGDRWDSGSPGGADLLFGDAGDDELYGGAANDYLDGGDGNDLLYGDAGLNRNYPYQYDNDDTIFGGAGDDKIYGEGGNDTLYTGTGRDFVDGGQGDDKIYADGSFADGADFLYGSAGNDVYFVAGGNILFRGDAADDGYDRIEISANVSLVYGDGTDLIEIEEIALTGAGAFYAGGNSLDNVIAGNAWNNTLIGRAGADQLFGNDGNDRLEGGFGWIDTLRGGAGNDTYVLNDFDDIAEGGDQGHDIVESSIDRMLPVNFEDLVLTGFGNTDGTGNGASNILTGNSGNNRLDGGFGYDELDGGAGNDTYLLGSTTLIAGGYQWDLLGEDLFAGTDTVYASADAGRYTYQLGLNFENLVATGVSDFRLWGNEANNSLTGNAGANVLEGFGGNDLLRGQSGLDTLNGGGGNDDYLLADATLINGGYTWDSVTEAFNSGIDTVYASADVGRYTYQLGANVENLKATGASDFRLWGNEGDNGLTGNIGANVLAGFGGNDTLNGERGLDDLSGDGGNDTYILADATLINGGYTWDAITEGFGAGVDTVFASADVGRYTYQLGANVENLTATGASAFRLWGNELDNRLTGNAAADDMSGFLGADRLDGKGGLDSLAGGGGDDIYVLADATLINGGYTWDGVTEAFNGGTDTVFASADVGRYTYQLSANVENLVATGASIFRLWGNAGDNSLTGNAAANLIAGYDGADTLIGGMGDDSLAGGIGADLLGGGVGRDVLSGGGGGDTFFFGLFSGVAQSGISAATADRIIDWSAAADRINMIGAAAAGSPGNYMQTDTGATSISAAAMDAEAAATSLSTTYVFLFNTNTDTGYLLADLDGDHAFETGIVLAGAGSAADFGFGNIV